MIDILEHGSQKSSRGKANEVSREGVKVSGDHAGTLYTPSMIKVVISCGLFQFSSPPCVPRAPVSVSQITFCCLAARTKLETRCVEKCLSLSLGNELQVRQFS